MELTQIEKEEKSITEVTTGGDKESNPPRIQSMEITVSDEEEQEAER